MSIDNFIFYILGPALLAICGIFWTQIDSAKRSIMTETGKLWIDIGSFKEAYAKNRLEDERRYVNKDNLSEFKNEVRSSLDDVRKSVDKLVDKIDRGNKTSNRTG